MLQISIIEGHHQALSRSTKNGTRYYQKAYAHMGGAFPQEIEIPLRSPAEAYPVGDFSLSVSTFQVGKYKNLELNPFEVLLVPAQKSFSKAS